MTEFTFPEPATHPRRSCPRCGRVAAIHKRVVRAVYDWEITFIDCLRLRCCGGTFLATPRGLEPRLRYSSRVVALARALYSAGVPFHSCSRLLTRLRVPVTPQGVRRWCRGIAPETRSEVTLASAPHGDVAVHILPTTWLAIRSEAPAEVLRILRREAVRLVHPEVRVLGEGTGRTTPETI